MRNNNIIILIVAVGVILLGFMYFSQNRATDGNLEDAMERVGDTADDTIDKVDDAADRAIRKID